MENEPILWLCIVILFIWLMTVTLFVVMTWFSIDTLNQKFIDLSSELERNYDLDSEQETSINLLKNK